MGFFGKVIRYLQQEGLFGEGLNFGIVFPV